LKLAWRDKNYYAAGAAEQELVPSGDLAALQQKVQEIGAGFLAQ
jgi:hypothetical protein